MTAAPTTLTPRQLAVAVLIADGYTNKQVATALRISVRQVETYVSSIASRWKLDPSKNLRAQITRRVLEQAA